MLRGAQVKQECPCREVEHHAIEQMPEHMRTDADVLADSHVHGTEYQREAEYPCSQQQGHGFLFARAPVIDSQPGNEEPCGTV